jgi:hypothetical protein
MRQFRWLGGLTVGIALGLCGAAAEASVVPTTIIGEFGGVITNGNVLHSPDIFSSTAFDNAGSAVFAISNSTTTATTGNPPIQSTGSALIWGDDAAGAGQPSTLDFFGAVIPSNINQPFFIGRLTFSNGTSSLGSIIFGATISFYDGTVSPENFLGTDTIVINTTANIGASTAQDADYLNICGNQSNICDNSIDAVESSQGGNGLTVDLFGTIVGDPQLFLTSVAVADGQSPTGNGFIGADPAAALIPEPSTIALFGAALLGVVATRLRSGRSRGAWLSPRSSALRGAIA